VERCLLVDPALRFSSAAELAAALDAALSRVEATVGPTPPLTTLTEALHRLASIPQDHLTGEESTALETS
jgi:hypothetical protein